MALQLYLLARIDILAGIQSIINQFSADIHKLTQQGKVIDLGREVARTQQRRAAAGELRQIGRAAQLLESRILFQHRLERHRIGDHVALDQAHHRLIDTAMQWLEEMFGLQLELHILRDAVVNHQRAEQRSLRFDVARQFQPALFGSGIEFHEFDHCALIAPRRGSRKGEG